MTYSVASKNRNEFDLVQGLKIAEIPDVIKVCQNIPVTAMVNHDSYGFSSVYNIFTGRNGLWQYVQDDVVAFVMRHPNIEYKYVVLPAFSMYNCDLTYGHTYKLFTELCDKYPDVHFQLGRIPKEWCTECDKYFQYMEENVLDWKYPCRILSTQLVTELYGTKLQQVRQRLNQLDKTGLVVQSIDIEKDKSALIEATYEWATTHDKEKYTYEDLVSPSLYLFNLMGSGRFNLYGQKVTRDNKIKAFCIYEQNQIIANEFSISADNNIPGLSEFQMYQMCTKLYSMGTRYVNIGGSETVGLDRFKKKFNPIISHELCSYICKNK